MRRSIPESALLVLAALAIVPTVVLWQWGGTMVMPPQWVHFYGVGLSALVAAAAATALLTVGARRGDPRTVIMAGGFTIMSALLAVHGLVTPGVLVGRNGVVALSGAATLPVGAAVLALSGVRRLNSPRSIPLVITVQGAIVLVVIAVSAVGIAVPRLVPSVPAARSTAAWALLAVGLALFTALAFRAANTFLLTRRAADLAAVTGLVLLSASLYGSLALTFMDLGWWLGHAGELVGIALVGGSVAYDLRRGSQSRPLIGDLRTAEIVAAEEAFLGARVRALMVRLAEKDQSTEEHTRRVASLAVEVGEELGIPAARLRILATGGLLHDVGKLSIPDSILQKPAALDEGEFAVVKHHPERGKELLIELGGFDEAVQRLVLDHHERLDGTGYPRGATAAELDLETRILTVCDVYDALVSARVYRPAWPVADAIALLREETGTAFDPRCVEALIRVVGIEAGISIAS